MNHNIMLNIPKSIASGAVVRLYDEDRTHAFGSDRGSDAIEEEMIP